VLPIGGLKEKLLAALRGGMKKVLIPEENAQDLAEIPDNVKSGLDILPVARMDDALKIALTRKLQPIKWDEEAEEAAAAARAKASREEGLTAH
jgi:ATP-dependent Lon protease